MENKTNIAELLKDCPKGMELECSMFDDVKFIGVEIDDKPICIRTGNIYRYLTKFGTWTFDENAKCVIFPKGKTTWEGFKPPCKFKDGDIVVNASNKDSNAFIYAGEGDNYYHSYVGLTIGTNPELSTDKSLAWVSKESGIRFASEEEKQKLFNIIQNNGYKWNEKTKTLEKLIEPKFKVGYRIIKKGGTCIFDVVLVSLEYYIVRGLGRVYEIPIKEQDNFNLVPTKFDINTLKPFESKVLVRDYDDQHWTGSFYSNYDAKDGYPFHCILFGRFKQCIPYEGNEHLLDKNDDCDDYFKTWE